VLSAHQGEGEPLRPMPLEITRCLRVPGAEPAPPPVRRGPGRVVAVDTPWSNDQACHSCGRRRFVPAAPPRALPSTRPCAPAWTPPHDLCRLPRLRSPVEGGDSPFFPSPWQASHCSRVRCSFPLTVIGPERGCDSSPSTTLSRLIASSIDIVERSSRDSIERAICLYFSGMHRKSFSTALSSP
jgi:hypothetical protein